MTVKTPKYWDKYEKVEETTAYGNKVMVPRGMSTAWELLHQKKQFCEEHGIDPRHALNPEKTSRPRVKDVIRIFWEDYED